MSPRLCGALRSAQPGDSPTARFCAGFGGCTCRASVWQYKYNRRRGVGQIATRCVLPYFTQNTSTSHLRAATAKSIQILSHQNYYLVAVNIIQHEMDHNPGISIKTLDGENSQRQTSVCTYEESKNSRPNSFVKGAPVEPPHNIVKFGRASSHRNHLAAYVGVS